MSLKAKSLGKKFKGFAVWTDVFRDFASDLMEVLNKINR